MEHRTGRYNGVAKQPSHVQNLPGGPTTSIAVPTSTSTAVCVFHWPSEGELETGTTDDHPVEFNGTAYQAWAHLTNPVGAPTTGLILLNGVSIGSWTIPSGQKNIMVTLSSVVSADAYDFFAVDVTAVGTTCSGSKSSGLWVGVFVR